MHARMKHPAFILPDAMKALHALHKSTEEAGISQVLQELVFLRASQINGCHACVEAGTCYARQGGESDARLFAVAGWQKARCFTDAERAALGLAEAVTRLSDQTDPVPDDIWNEAVRHYEETALATLVLAIANVNVWNRLNAATRQVAGVWKP